MRATALALVLLCGCGRTQGDLRSLHPYPNPLGPGHPDYVHQPDRDHPQEVVVDGQGRAWVSLPGAVDFPGSEVAVATDETVERIALDGSSPVGMALHPDGRWLVVFQRFSNFAALIDTRRDRVEGPLRMDFYAIEGAFTPDGSELWVTNRWRDAVAVYRVDADADGLRLEHQEDVPVGTNPRDLAISKDGRWVAVGTITGGEAWVIDTRDRTARAVDLGAPANGLAWADGWLVVGTTSASTHHEPDAGPDTDGDGQPGDGTPNVNFQDLQNELAVIDPAAAAITHRYTSDTLCCFDFRDVDPSDLERGGDLLPPADTWIVGGAMPEQVVAQGSSVWVSYSGSSQLQRFEIDGASGALTADPPVPSAGLAPHGMAFRGAELLVAHTFSETVGVYDAVTGRSKALLEVGDLSGGKFPATDAEIGELFNTVTAPFTVDGDQTCTHCHREGSNIDKAFSMPLTAYPGVGLRMAMGYRGAGDSQPWFHEAAFDADNFRPVMNEFARIENFCCSDYTMWPEGAPQDCATNPPPACASSANAQSANGFDPGSRPAAAPVHPRPVADLNRDDFYLRRAGEVFGRQESFGDSVYQEDPISGQRDPVLLRFDGITRALGAFLRAEPRLLPNPNPSGSEAAQRGKALFERADVGCVRCHPGPSFSVSTDHNPSGLPLRMDPVVSPNRAEDGTNLDLFAQGFVEAFPLGEQDRCEEICDPHLCEQDPTVCDDLRNVRFGVPPLRGIWDRARSMLHDGRAKGLREMLCTPGHPALEPGEVGFNERDGVVDTHGGTSHLSAREIADLIAYVETL